MEPTTGEIWAERDGYAWVRRRESDGSSTAHAGAPAAAKRLLDVACASLGLVLTLPAWVVIPLLIKLEDGGAVFFVQERMGREGAGFRLLKFRSMDPSVAEREEVGSPAVDPAAVTRVGRLIRPTALDELPQLLSVLKGDMSLVGPRALSPEEKAEKSGERVDAWEIPGFRERQSVRPGLTGLAQLTVPREAAHRDKFRLDVLYVRRRTLWLDLKLILLSVWVSLRGAWPEIGRDRW